MAAFRWRRLTKEKKILFIGGILLFMIMSVYIYSIIPIPHYSNLKVHASYINNAIGKHVDKVGDTFNYHWNSLKNKSRDFKEGVQSGFKAAKDKSINLANAAKDKSVNVIKAPFVAANDLGDKALQHKFGQNYSNDFHEHVNNVKGHIQNHIDNIKRGISHKKDQIKNKTIDVLNSMGVINRISDMSNAIKNHPLMNVSKSDAMNYVAGLPVVGSVIHQYKGLRKKVVALVESYTQPEVSTDNCICEMLYCYCCSRVDIPALHLNKTMCATFQYKNDGKTSKPFLDFKFLVNKKEIYKQEIQTHSTTEVCPDNGNNSSVARICTEFSNITASIECHPQCVTHMSGCVHFNLYLLAKYRQQIKLSCFQIPYTKKTNSTNKLHISNNIHNK